MNPRMPQIGALAQPKLTAHIPQLTAHNPQLTAHQSRLTAHSSRLTAHSPQLTAHGSHSARLTTHSVRLTAHGSRLRRRDRQEENIPGLTREEARQLCNLQPWDEDYVHVMKGSVRKIRKQEHEEWKKQMRDEFNDTFSSSEESASSGEKDSGEQDGH